MKRDTKARPNVNASRPTTHMCHGTIHPSSKGCQFRPTALTRGTSRWIAWTWAELQHPNLIQKRQTNAVRAVNLASHSTCEFGIHQRNVVVQKLYRPKNRLRPMCVTGFEVADAMGAYGTFLAMFGSMSLECGPSNTFRNNARKPSPSFCEKGAALYARVGKVTEHEDHSSARHTKTEKVLPLLCALRENCISDSGHFNNQEEGPCGPYVMRASVVPTGAVQVGGTALLCG